MLLGASIGKPPEDEIVAWLLFRQRVVDGLLQRHRASGGAGGGEGFFAELCARSNDIAIIFSSVSSLQVSAKRIEQSFCCAEQPCRSLWLPLRLGHTRQSSHAL